MARRRRNEDHADDANEHLNGADESDEPQFEATPPLNSAARADIIRDADAEIGEYEKQIEGLKAEIKAVVETRIVAGLGMKKRDFALARKLVALDHGERDHLQDSIRECFAALGVGQQLNWLDATEGERADA